MREYLDVVAYLLPRVGTGLSAADVDRVTSLTGRILTALADQEERVVAGLPLRQLPDDAYERLWGPEARRERLRIEGVPPTFEGRLAAAWLRMRRRGRR